VMSDRGMTILPIYERGLENLDAVEAAAIPIERATGPILLISGGDDHMWPAARMCGMAMERMARHGRARAVRHLNYPEAGHVLVPRRAAPPNVPRNSRSGKCGARRRVAAGHRAPAANRGHRDGVSHDSGHDTIGDVHGHRQVLPGRQPCVGSLLSLRGNVRRTTGN
jgi:hypothetical protein